MLSRCIVITFLAAFAGQVAAQDGKPLRSSASSYPARPIRLICPFPPGGAADMTARMLAQRFSDQLREQVVVDNRSGAAGVIGVQIAAKSPARMRLSLLKARARFSPRYSATTAGSPGAD